MREKERLDEDSREKEESEQKQKRRESLDVSPVLTTILLDLAINILYLQGVVLGAGLSPSLLSLYRCSSGWMLGVMAPVQWMDCPPLWPKEVSCNSWPLFSGCPEGIDIHRSLLGLLYLLIVLAIVVMRGHLVSRLLP